MVTDGITTKLTASNIVINVPRDKSFCCFRNQKKGKQSLKGQDILSSVSAKPGAAYDLKAFMQSDAQRHS